ncbi:MAG: CPBP family intramembrane metalloprotease [Acidobacteria bacterium]|nr:CPBP family intramembrane metalloprotease [Acidobacteriota bacterium]
MNPLRFSRSDRNFTLVLAALVLASAAYIRLEYDKAFPQASLKLARSRAEITSIAEGFLASQGLRTAGFRQLTVFDPDDDARLYLERELGLERANQLMQREAPVWSWRARWYRPPDKEELVAAISPDGRVTGFEHVIPEAEAGARLTRDQALAIAEKFRQGRSSADMHLVEDRLEQRPNRNDFVFTWERDGFKAKDASLRLTVSVQGDHIGHFREFLHIPEGWQRDFSAMRSRNEMLAAIAEAFWLPLALAALALLVQGLRRRRIPWRPVLAISAGIGAMAILSQLNMIPLLVDAFPTSSPYLQTLALVILEALGAGVGVFVYIVIPAAAGEPGYRERTGDRLSLRTLLTPSGLGSRAFYRAVIVGYAFAALHLAFIVAFYLVGRRFGVWSPQDVQYSNLLSTALPLIYPIALASMAAASEEFWFRLLAIPLLERLLKLRWLAVVIPAFVWGFLHANYPQQPAYIRGVEVGVIGVAAGFLMLRYGIAATLVWHFTVDAGLMGGFLFESPSWYFRLNGILVALAILAPLMVNIVLYRRQGAFSTLDDAEAVAVAEPAPEEPAPVAAEPVPPVRAPWDIRWLYALAIVAAIGGALAVPRTFGDWIQVRVGARQAEAIARRALPNGAAWRVSTDFNANLDAAEFEYLRRQLGPEAAQRIVRERRLSAVWRVRFYRPQVKEEWRVYVDQSGAIVRKDHLLDERAPGDRLTAAQARDRASAALPWPGMVAVESNEERRDQRTDWAIVFEDSDFRVADARARVSVEVHGGEVSNVRRFLKLPEAWLRDFQKPTLRNFAIPALLGSLGMPLLVLFIRRLAAHDIVFHWRVYLAVAVCALAVAAVSAVNASATAMTGYDTANPEQNYVTQFAIGRAVLTVLLAAGAFAVMLSLDVFRQSALGPASLNPPSLGRAAAVTAVIAGVSRLMQWALQAVPGPRAALPVWNLAGLDNYLPGYAALSQGFLAAVFGLGIGGTLAFAVIRYMHPKRRMIAAGVTIAAVAISQSLTASQFAAHAVSTAVWIAVAVAIALTCSADLIALGVALFWAASLRLAWQMFRQPQPFIQWNGAAAMAAAIIGGIVLIRVWGVVQRPRPENVE